MSTFKKACFDCFFFFFFFFCFFVCLFFFCFFLFLFFSLFDLSVDCKYEYVGLFTQEKYNNWSVLCKLVRPAENRHP